MLRLDNIKEDDVLYEMGTYGMGNTKMTAQGVTVHRIIAVHRDTVYHAVGGELGQKTRTIYPHAVNARGEKLSEARIGKLKRSPPEWLKRGMFARICHFCHAEEKDGHRDSCKHPRAVKARAKAAKS